MTAEATTPRTWNWSRPKPVGRGPVFRYRGAEIRGLKGGHVCGLVMPGHPLDGSTFGVPGTITPLVDLWIREQRLPDYMRPAAPRPKAPGLEVEGR